MAVHRRPFTLSIDIGGTGLKASVLDAGGALEADPIRVPTPYPCPPKTLVSALAAMARDLPSFDRVSVGFPGVVRKGLVLTAPHFGGKVWRRYPLAAALRERWGKPVRLLNDADMQGFAVIRGRGLELVVTLGYGVGTAVYRDGALMPRLELAQHPVLGAGTYNEFIGDRTLKRIGPAAWNKRVRLALGWLTTLLNPDFIHLGGGNARLVRPPLPRNLKKAPPQAGVLGGIALWKSRDFKG